MATKVRNTTAGGDWSFAPDWTLTGAPAATDDAIIFGPIGINQILNGTGAAATMLFLGGTTLNGAFTTGALTVGNTVTAGQLNLAPGATLAASTATLLDGTLTVSGAGATLAIGLVLTFGGDAGLQDSLTVADGASVQLGSVALASSSNEFSLTVDSTSTLEVGSTGGVATGTLQVDAGQTLGGAGALSATSIANAGTIAAQGGELDVNAGVTGAGQLQVAANATLSLRGVSTEGVSFTGANATLSITNVIYTATGVSFVPSEQGTITGFAAGDTIQFGGAITTATYQSTGANIGTLTLRDGTQVAGTLTLAGDYTGDSFAVAGAVENYQNDEDITLIAAVSGSGAASPGTAAADSYNWVGAGGAWGTLANWVDVTSGASPATIAPGSNDAVTITGGTYGFSGSAAQVVDGPGNSASLTVLGATALDGQFSTGALTVGSATNTSELDLAPGAVLAATTASVLAGSVDASGAGTTLTIAGALTLGASSGTFGNLSAAGGATVQVGGPVSVAGLININVDSASAIEFGSTGGAAAGALTIDAGQVIGGQGSLAASGGIANAGTIEALGGNLEIYGAVTGAGQIAIGAGAHLELNSGISTEGVTFTGAGGLLGATDQTYTGSGIDSQLSEQGTITGFASGDTIAYGGAVTTATYQSTGADIGTLTLTDGAATVGTLTLAGNYSGDSFAVAPASPEDGSNSDITLNTAAAGAAGLSAGTTGADTYVWTGGAGSAWGNAANWNDTSATATTIAPGANDLVTISGPATDNSGGLGVSGPGDSASLTTLGATTLTGAFAMGTLTVGSAGAAAAVTLAPGTVLNAALASVPAGTITASGAGAALTVSGAVTLGGGAPAATGGLSAAGGAAVTIGSLSGAGSLSVDSTSTLEIGATGGAVAGVVTIDAGETVTNLSLNSATGVANAGTILAQGGETDISGGPVTGAGQMEIGANGVLNLEDGVTTQGVSFIGADGTLDASQITYGAGGQTAQLTEQGTITGFASGDTIEFAGAITTAAYQPTGGNMGTLTLSDGTEVVGALSLAGDYSDDAFEVTPAAGGSGGATYAISLTAKPGATTTPFDFNEDGRSDLLLQNTDGTIVIETAAGLSLSGAAVVGDPGAAWHVAGSADFNGDGQSDILVQNTDGAIVDYMMNGTSVASSGYLGDAGPAWHVRGAGDFGGNADASVVLQNDNGAIVIWYTDGAAVTGAAYVGNPGAGWTVEGVADFNGDGQPDILVQNTNGALVVYTMAGATITAGAYLGNPGAGWSVAGTGNYGGTADASILLHNDDGADVIWDTNGSAVTGATFVGNPGADYTDAVTGLDLTGDGSPSLVLQNTDSTLVGFTLDDTATITAGAVLGAPGAGWSAIGNNPVQYVDGTSGNTSLAATPGADQFDLTSYAAGSYTITSFDPALDSVAFSSALFASYAAVQAAETAYQGGTSIQLAGGSTLVIQGVTPGQLTAADFVFR